MSRISLLLAVALVACAGGQGNVDLPMDECRPWGSWKDVGGIPSFKWRIRYCGHEEVEQKQIWQAQFRNDHRYGISFSYGLGEEQVRYRMDLSASRTRSSTHLRVYAIDPNQMMWVHFEGYCTWAAGERSCSG